MNEIKGKIPWTDCVTYDVCVASVKIFLTTFKCFIKVVLNIFTKLEIALITTEKSDEPIQFITVDCCIELWNKIRLINFSYSFRSIIIDIKKFYKAAGGNIIKLYSVVKNIDFYLKIIRFSKIWRDCGQAIKVI